MKIDKPPQRLSIDWKAYFKAYLERHGDPVRWGERLLFRDGRQYSALDYAGPEYAPPADEDELARLKIEYWRRRRVECKQRYDELKLHHDELVQLQHQKGGIPLTIKTATMDENTGLWHKVKSPLDLELMAMTLEMVRGLMAEADQELRTLIGDRHDRSDDPGEHGFNEGADPDEGGAGGGQTAQQVRTSVPV